MTQYMSRRKFFVPKDEIERNYKQQGDKNPSDYLFECDYEDDTAET
jgi:hypothetical protein